MIWLLNSSLGVKQQSFTQYDKKYNFDTCLSQARTWISIDKMPSSSVFNGLWEVIVRFVYIGEIVLIVISTVYALSFHKQCALLLNNTCVFSYFRSSWSSTYGSWIYNIANHHSSCEFESYSRRGVLDTILCDKVCHRLTPRYSWNNLQSGVKHHNPLFIFALAKW
jgi:hypothetical protein